MRRIILYVIVVLALIIAGFAVLLNAAQSGSTPKEEIRVEIKNAF